MGDLAEEIGGLPNICGSEPRIDEALRASELGAGRLEEETAGASRKLIASKDDGVDSR